MNGKATGTHLDRSRTRLAEARLRRKLPIKRVGNKMDPRRLLHELEVHQIELEMPNEELRLARTQSEVLLSGKLHEERIRMEALLAEYTDLYDNAPTGYLTLNREGVILKLNFACARLLGGERSRLVRRRLALFVEKNDRKIFASFLGNVFGGQGTDRCEIRMPQPSSPSIIVLMEGVCFARRQECRIVIFDVSEQKRSEQTRGQLAAIVESFSDAIISTTVNGEVTNWNPAAQRVFGFSAVEMIGRSIDVIVPPDYRAKHRGMIDRIRSGETVDAYETKRLTKDGLILLTELTVFPVRDHTGNIVGVSSILRDITARKTIERQLVEIAERERREVGRDLHDGLSQHLHALHFLSTLLQRDLKKERSSCGATAARLSALLREAATLTRDVAHGLQPVRPVPEGLMTALHKLAARAKALFRLECELVCRPAVLIASNGVATHLYRIAQEAVSNAATHAKSKHVRIALHADAGRIVLAVTDDGRGIRSTRRGHEGMGLHLMQHRANAIGGSLAIRPLPNGGTVVICSIPTGNETMTALPGDEP